MGTIFEVEEGNRSQTSWEEIAYVVNTSKVVAAPDSATIPHIYDLATNTNVKSTVMPTSTVTVSGAYLTLSELKSLTIGRTYRVDIAIVDGGAVYAGCIVVPCEI